VKFLNYSRLLLFLILAFALFSVVNADILIDREMKADTTDPKILVVTLNVTPQDVEKYDIAELYPVGWTIVSWDVKGNLTPLTFEQVPSTYKEKYVTLLHWNFSDNSPVVLSYNAQSSQTMAGDEQLISIVVYPGGFSTNNYLLSLGEGGVIKQSVSVQPIVSFKELSSTMVALILVILVVLLVYYVWKIKNRTGTEVNSVEVPRSIIPPKPAVIKPAQPKQTLFKQAPSPKPTTAKPILPVALPKPPVKPAALPSFKKMLGAPPPPPPAARAKPKTAKPKQKSAKFYKNTIKRLERIEKSLKKK